MCCFGFRFFVILIAIIAVNETVFAQADSFFRELTPEFEARLVYHLNHPLVAVSDKKKISTFLKQRRYLRCMRRFRWKPICDQTATFFMWAQILAKDILNGKYIENPRL